MSSKIWIKQIYAPEALWKGYLKFLQAQSMYKMKIKNKCLM